ncbi:MAG TPA: phosphoribosylglycinamide formyltransferase [Firmicutes bacterium]|nr:phosphoribosylglycinamide formyltransferase [Bacillota bacterium]
MSRLGLGVLASGRGSNLVAIMDAIDEGRLSARVLVVVSDQENAPALARARERGVEAIALPRSRFRSREDHDNAIASILVERGVDLVVLAGYMRILSKAFIKRFEGRIMNIHPALLPSFPGLNAQAQALSYGVKVSGCTVHFVDEGVDTGPIILQRAVPVLEDDTPETLAERILRQEHEIYPEAIQLFAEGRLVIEGRRVRIRAPRGAPDGGPPGVPCDGNSCIRQGCTKG